MKPEQTQSSTCKVPVSSISFVPKDFSLKKECIMNVTRQLRIISISLVLMALVVAFNACSKKDVVSDEPILSPTGNSGVASPSGVESGNLGTGNAGDVGVGSADLQTVFFDYDSFNLRSDARNALKSNGDWMKKHSSVRIQIEGHCDERGTNEYNMALGDRRANAAKSFLVKMGVSKSRIDTISYGEERPSDPGHDESAYSKNRRAAFILLSK